MDATIVNITSAGKTIDAALLKRQNRLDRWRFGLFVSSILGSAAGLCGLAIGGLSLIGVVAYETTLAHVGNALLIAAFPLLIIAAHCLDKADQAEKEIRLEFCRRHGLDDKVR